MMKKKRQKRNENIKKRMIIICRVDRKILTFCIMNLGFVDRNSEEKF